MRSPCSLKSIRTITPRALSAAGRRAFGEMARRHEGWIVEMFAGLAESERNALYTMLAKLKRHLNAVESESAR